MIQRPFWVRRCEVAWKQAPIVWLCGVRRCGKTTLAQSFGKENTFHINCDIPSTEEQVRSPELFYRSCEKKILVFDEIHQLRDPSRLLKIGADLFPHLKILATGSSTLFAGKKFKDTLTGRKRTIHLTPVLLEESADFGNASLVKRLFHGGLPQALLAKSKEPSFYREWMDSFFSRDIQHLFGFRDIEKFNLLFEYLLRQSGGIFESSKAARALLLSRPTIENHVRALETTHAITIVRPYHKHSQTELVKAPKLYAFDTGFVSFARGWNPLRTEDYGFLWEHLVLEHLQAHLPNQTIHYWRDTRGHEIDFVLPRTRNRIDVLECKWNPQAFDSRNLEIFRGFYPRGNNYLITPDAPVPYWKEIKKMKIKVGGPEMIPSS